MRISYNWLKEYINLNIKPEKLAEILTMSGLTTESVQKTEDDHIFEIEVTANRPDWLSYIGIARELSAITGAKLKIPLVKSSKRQMANGKKEIKVTVEEKALCPRYTARVIKNVKVGQSSNRMKKKLAAMGLKAVNNIVDITNFCLFETGEPMHAFDLDKIDGGQIIVRKARKGEKITTIDGVERELSDTMLIIADKSKPIAIAGVMGGINTEITYTTKNILLEAASFDQISVRRTARALGIFTESSYRFERKIDPNNIIHSSNRATGLIFEMASGAISEFIDIGKKDTPKNTVTLRLSRLSSILGLDIPLQKVKKIINALGIKIKKASGDNVNMDLPQFRCDLSNEIDIIEEIARIYGYNKLPSTIPGIVEQGEKVPPSIIIERKIREILTGLGLDEILTYSLLSKKVLNMACLTNDSVVEIKNPLSNEQEVMRPSLMPGLLSTVLWNINRKTKDLKFFELGEIYLKSAEDKLVEKKHLAFTITGEVSNWVEGSREQNFFDLKGFVEVLLSELGIEGAIFKQIKDDAYSYSCAASVEILGETIGKIGEVSRMILNNFDIKETVYFCEICLDIILKHANLGTRFIEIPKYPSVYRDISLIISKETSNTDLMTLAKDAAGTILNEIKLIDRYSGKQIPEGKVSLTYRLEYRDLSRTLEEKDISSVHSKILRSLEEKYGAKLR